MPSLFGKRVTLLGPQLQSPLLFLVTIKVRIAHGHSATAPPRTYLYCPFSSLMHKPSPVVDLFIWDAPPLSLGLSEIEREKDERGLVALSGCDRLGLRENKREGGNWLKSS
ncbi:hypothetical protein L2E82_51722 [Cichorium intybus]|nr:hypothetical protein L2E82_51722 [Cichorium intybus]